MRLMTELRYSGTVTPNRTKLKARRKIEARSDQKSDAHNACAEVIQAAAKRLSSTSFMSGYPPALPLPKIPPRTPPPRRIVLALR